MRLVLASLLAAFVAFPATAQSPAGCTLDGTLTGVLTGSKAVPATASAARGALFGFLNFDGNLSLNVYVSGLEGDVQDGTIRSGDAGTRGPVLFTATELSRSGEDLTVRFQVQLGRAQAAQLEAGALYVSIESDAFPEGELRAQIEASTDLDNARECGAGTAVTVFGYVVRARGRAAYVNDETGGLALFQPSGPFFEAVQSGAVRPGTVVRLTGTLSDARGQLQIGPGDLASFEVAQRLSENIDRRARVVTLAEIAADPEALESVLVAVPGVTLAGGAGGTFEPSRTYAADDGSAPAGPVTVRVPAVPETAVPGQPVPTGPATVLGVLGQFSAAMPPEGGTQILVIEDGDPDSRGAVRVVHTAPDPRLATIEVAADGRSAQVAFRSATGLLSVPAYTPVEVWASSDAAQVSASATVAVVPGDAPTVLVLGGVADPNRFAANPDGAGTALSLYQVSPLITFPDDDVVGIAFVNGTPDAPGVDVRSGLRGPVIYATDLGYGGGPYQIGLGARPYSFTVARGLTSFGSFEVDLSGLDGQTVLMITSGFLDPAANQGGPEIGLLTVREDGSTVLSPRLATAGEGAPGAPALRVAATANPVRSQTAIRYTLPAPGRMRLSVVDVLGREVALLATGEQAAGTHEAPFDASRLAPGVYTLRLVAAGAAATARITVVR